MFRRASRPSRHFRRRQVEWRRWERVSAMPHEHARTIRLPIVVAPIVAPVALFADAVRRSWVIHSGLRSEARRDTSEAFVEHPGTALPSPQELESSVLLLRSFGGDGGLQIAAAHGSSEPGPTVTIEEILTTTAHVAGLNGVHALHDHDADMIPSSVNYIRIPREGWEGRVAELVAHARIIVLLATPGHPLGPSFRDELAMIRASGRVERTMVVGAPGDDEHTHEILEELRWPIPASVPLVAHLRDDRRLRIHPAVGPRDLTDAGRYHRAIADGLEHLLDTPVTGRTPTRRM